MQIAIKSILTFNVITVGYSVIYLVFVNNNPGQWWPLDWHTITNQKSSQYQAVPTTTFHPCITWSPFVSVDIIYYQNANWPATHDICPSTLTWSFCRSLELNGFVYDTRYEIHHFCDANDRSQRDREYKKNKFSCQEHKMPQNPSFQRALDQIH